MAAILKPDFFNRDTKTIAQELLGKFLIRSINGKTQAAMITETEAYDGPHDLASHASRGRTGRTEIMFGHPGYFYVYLVYGIHEMLNVVTREHGYPAAVLIRAVATEDGQHINGPGKVTKFLHIDRSLNAKPAAKATGLWFEDRGVAVPTFQRLPRIGVAYAGPIWSAKKLRFTVRTLPPGFHG